MSEAAVATPPATNQTPAPTPTPAPNPAPAATPEPKKDSGSILGPDVNAPKPGEPKPGEAPAPAPKAPKKYTDFKMPEGMNPSKEALDKFTPLFKEADLSQDMAQKFVDAQIAFEQSSVKSQVAALEKQNQDWVSELKIAWGADYDKQTGLAAKGIEAVGGAELRTWLHKNGLGNLPQLAKAFAKVGDMVSEGQPGDGRKDNNAQPKSDGAVLYPKMKEKPDGQYRE